MHPEKLGFDERDLSHVLKIVGKETQTSNHSIAKKPERSTNSLLFRETPESNKGEVCVFEFCQVLDDSESTKSVIIVKETLTEEKVDHSKEPSPDTALSNRYRYCKEVIKPYLKSYFEDCPVSEDQLIRQIIHSTDQEYPDYQTCFEAYEGRKNTGSKTIHSVESSVSKIDAVTSYNSAMDSQECPPKAPTSSTVLQNSRIQESVCDKEKSDKPKSEPETATADIKMPPSTPTEEKPLPKPSCPPAADTSKELKLLEKSSKTDSANIDVKTKPMVPAHNETLATIKTAMEDFITKAYKTTQDAVTVITTESAKHLEAFRQTKSSSAEKVQPKSSGVSKTEEALASFNILRSIESKDKKDDTSDDQETITPNEILERIVGKVESTISMISDNVSFENISDIVKPTKFKDPSSPYDVPTPPKEISHIIVREPARSSNSVFAAIKNRFFSMFSESDDNPKDVTENGSQNPPSTPTREDSDEDLINRLIE